MARNQYKFDHTSLSYEKVEYTFGQKLLRLIPLLGLSVFFAILIVIAFNTIYKSPSERKLARELKFTQNQLEILNSRFEKVEAVLSEMEHRDDNIYRAVFNAEPIPSTIREAGFGGSYNYERYKGYENSDLVIETARRLDQISKKMLVQSKSYDEIADMVKNKEDMMAHVPAIQPISNKDLTRIASGWGWRTHPIYKIRKFHYGVDFTANTGTPIYATGAGKIVKTRSSRIGYGRQIVIDHGYGYQTLYAHMSKFNVKKGDKVKRGDIIGFVGSTGTSTAPHLHYEILKNGKKVDPKYYFIQDLTPTEYEEMIEIFSKGGQSFD